MIEGSFTRALEMEKGYLVIFRVNSKSKFLLNPVFKNLTNSNFIHRGSQLNILYIAHFIIIIIYYLSFCFLFQHTTPNSQ